MLWCNIYWYWRWFVQINMFVNINGQGEFLTPLKYCKQEFSSYRIYRINAKVSNSKWIDTFGQSMKIATNSSNSPKFPEFGWQQTTWVLIDSYEFQPNIEGFQQFSFWDMINFQSEKFPLPMVIQNWVHKLKHRDASWKLHFLKSNSIHLSL